MNYYREMKNMLWVLLAVFLIIWTLVKRWKNRRLRALAKQLAPKSIALPFVGHAYQFLGNDEERMETFKKIGREAMEKDGLIAHWQGNQLYIMVASAEAAEVLLKTCLEKDDITRLFKQLLGNGSLFAPVPVWRPRRKVQAPTFSQRNLNSFVEVFSRQSSIMSDQLRSIAGSGPFSMWKYLTSYAMDAICETTLGINVSAQSNPEQPFLNAVKNCFRLDAKRACQPWIHNETMYKLICRDDFNLNRQCRELIWSFLNKIVSSKCEALNGAKPDVETCNTYQQSCKSFLELLIQSKGGYSNVELREETLVIILAGTDTSAVGTAFTTLMLAKYPEVQEKVYQELQEVFGDTEGPVSPQDLPRLKYLDAVIKETLRLYPSVPFLVRKVLKDVTVPPGITLVDGCGLLISIWAIHRNPKYWGDDAELFRPERFFDSPPTDPAAYMPFSGGPRGCIGYQYAMMSMKTAISTLLRRYCILPGERMSDASEAKTGSSELRVKFDVMMKDVDDFVVRLELRN